MCVCSRCKSATRSNGLTAAVVCTGSSVSPHGPLTRQPYAVRGDSPSFSFNGVRLSGRSLSLHLSLPLFLSHALISLSFPPSTSPFLHLSLSPVVPAQVSARPRLPQGPWARGALSHEGGAEPVPQAAGGSRSGRQHRSGAAPGPG